MRTRLRTAASTWGDGFHDDGVAALWRVRGWDEVSRDEHAVVFPRLVPFEGGLPPVLRGRLDEAVRAHARRVGVRGPRPPWAVRAAHERAVRDAAVHGVLSGLAVEVAAGAVRPFSPCDAFALGFGAGFHPAYLWPEAAAAPVPGLAAAWLGVVAGGREALMPLAVAEHLLDGHPHGAGGAIGTGWADGRSWDRIVRAARDRVAGRDVPFRLAEVVPSPWAAANAFVGCVTRWVRGSATRPRGIGPGTNLNGR